MKNLLFITILVGIKGIAQVDKHVIVNSGTHKIAATISYPKGEKKKYPAVIFVHGSGCKTREYPYFKEVAKEAFNKRGYAVIMYDKPGCGGSTGIHLGLGVENSFTQVSTLSRDIEKIFDLLLSYADIATDDIGLFGISQAGWIIPVAATNRRFKFAVIASGPAVSVGEEMYYSSIVQNGVSITEANQATRNFKGLKGFEPKPYLASMQCPSLWLFGSADESIPVERSIGVLKKFFSQSKKLVYRIYPDAKHNLQNSKADSEIDIFSDIDNFLQRVRSQ